LRHPEAAQQRQRDSFGLSGAANKQAFAMVSGTPDMLASIRQMKNSPGDNRPGAFFINNDWRLSGLWLIHIAHRSPIDLYLIAVPSILKGPAISMETRSVVATDRAGPLIHR
jgi:hypothetical protein